MFQTKRFRAVAIALTLVATFLLLDLQSAVVQASSPNIVISQVYGGGGNTGATLKNDFIELFNRGAAAVNVNAWSVQYASTSGTTWSKTVLPNVAIQPGQYFLVQEAAGAGGTTNLPTPDAIGTISMSATGGKVTLVNNSTTLTGACPSGANIVDRIGYDGANCSETSPAGTLSNTLAALREQGGCIDTDNNAADFAGGAPIPRNTSSPFANCSLPPPPPLRIHDIQGASHISPQNGNTLYHVPGIVTALRSNGFYMQDSAPDSSDATSEGIFVFTSSAPTAIVGDAVTVNGAVSEFRPGGTGGTANLTTTELEGASAVVSAHGQPLPAPIVIGTGGRVPPSTVIEDDATGDVETSGVYDPASDGIDFYESLEGMRVQVNNAVAVGPWHNFGSNREIPVIGDNGANASVRTYRGGIVIRPNDFNPERIILNDLIAGGPTLPSVNVADKFPGAIVGVMDYSFGNWKLEVSTLPAVSAGGLARETAAASPIYQLATATFNVENLAPTDPPTKFSTLAGLIVNNLKAPDVIAIEEIQDNNGVTDDGTVDASTTWNMLISAIQTAGGPTYAYRQIDPVNGQDGGAPGGNIRQGFLFRADRGLVFVDHPGGTSTNSTAVTGSGAGTGLTFSPGRIDPTNAAFTDSRKPLAGEFTFKGDKVFIVANHFNSKGGDDPLFGHLQPPTFSSEVQRLQQAQVVHNFVTNLLTANPQANVIVLGDLNDFQFSSTLTTLKGTALNNLIDTLPQDHRYSYDYDGNSEVLDQILLGNSTFNRAFTYQVVHVNSEFADQVSDHEPQVAYLCVDATAPAVSVSVSPSELWPPNHKYVTVKATVSATDNADPNATIALVSVTSNEPDNGTGDGDTSNDIVIVNNTTFQLRAERSGSGTGRIYTITYKATDACGNSTVKSAAVTVPHDKGK